MHKKDPLVLLAYLASFVESLLSTNRFYAVDYDTSIKQNGSCILVCILTFLCCSFIFILSYLILFSLSVWFPSVSQLKSS